MMKKHDPNSKPPKIDSNMGNFSQFDKTLLREKAVELRKKFNRGKIIHEEFEREWNNLKKQYPGDFEADMTEGTPNPSYPLNPNRDPSQLPVRETTDSPPRVDPPSPGH